MSFTTPLFIFLNILSSKSFKACCGFLFLVLHLSAQDSIRIDSIPPPSSSIDTSVFKTVLVETVDSNQIVNADTSLLIIQPKKKKKLKGFFKKDYPNPKKAMLMSFIIPGSGQIYNKKYWKAPLAIGGTTAAIIIAVDNTRTYRLLNDQLRLRYGVDTTIIANPFFDNWENEDIERERDRFRKWREMSYIAIVLIQALGGVDAFVDAHFYGYKINEDLSMKIKPTLESSSAFGPTLGIGLSFHLH